MRWSRLIVLLLLWFFGIEWARAATIVHCVGDSITQGVGVSNPNVDSYPARLLRLLGTNYTVVNYGLSGTTLLRQGDMPYIGTPTYVLSHGRSSTSAPNVVVIMLGSNDSKSQNWQYGTNFYTNCWELVASYVTNVYLPNPRILLCTPPPVFNNGTAGINSGIVATNISPLIRQFGTNYNLQVIDMNVLLAGHNEWFPDNVHPNARGNAVMAAVVYTAIRGDPLNGTIPSLEINLLSPTSAALRWPVDGGGWVLQTTAALGTNLWTITTQPAVNNGSTLSLTNTVTTNTLFRLWRAPGGGP